MFEKNESKTTLCRRSFLKFSGAAVLAARGHSLADMRAPRLGSAKFRDGRIAIRFQVAPAENKTAAFAGRLNASKGRIDCVRRYFLEPTEDSFADDSYVWKSLLTPTDFDVLVVWLNSADESTTLSMRYEGGSFDFTLRQLLNAGQLNRLVNDTKITANFLYDKEIGAIKPEEVSITDPGDNFDFIIFADPQGGDPSDKTNDSPERIRFHNPVIEKNVELVNALPDKPAFTLIAGDIVDSKGQQSNYNVVVGMLQKLKTPVLFALGNHETRYSSRFSPAYNMAPLNNYFAAQKRMNGMDKLLYSFDLGRWHFVVWPDPLRSDFWQTHPHYFEWLADDLKANSHRPTIMFQHVSLMPLGIDPMIAYSEKIPVKKKLLEIITRYGNVRYVFSGHTHIPIRSSIKTARTYRGVKFINLPPAGYRPRAFGERDFDNEPSQGFALIRIQGESANVAFRNINGKEYEYPSRFSEFKPAEHPQWLKEDWRLPAGNKIVNGDFEEGLAGWKRRFVYQEEADPAAVRRISNETALSGTGSLYMYCGRREAMMRGQDRLPQTINRISQAIELEKGRRPVLDAAYRIDPEHFHRDADAGACIWIKGFSGSYNCLNLVYWVGKAIWSPQGLYGRQPRFAHFEITESPGPWRRVSIDIAADYDRTAGNDRFDDLGPDRLVITLGTWTDNIGENAEIGLYFDGFGLKYAASDAPSGSSIDGKPVRIRKNSTIWRKSIVHIDGEHVYKDRS